MAEAKFTTMTCRKCEGSLFFDEKKKNWRCKYCGTYVTVPINDPEIEGIARQILIEVAKGDLEKARQWLSECEKKDHTKVATIISRMSIAMEEVRTASNISEKNKSMSDLRYYMQQFWSKYRMLGPEETRLYESFGDDSADAFAELVYLFNSMRLEDHVQFCLKKLNTYEVRSTEMNGRLLEMAIDRKDSNLIQQILSNAANIDHVNALKLILESVSADEEESSVLKSGYIKKIADRYTVEHIDSRYFAEYFEKSNDPIRVKIELLYLIQESSLRLDTKRVFDALKKDLKEKDYIVTVLHALYKKNVVDSDTQGILVDEMITEGGDEERLITVLSFMDERRIYTSLNSKVIVDCLARKDISAVSKCKILRILNNYPLDNAVRNAVLKGYLCENNSDTPDARREILAFLLKFAPSVTTQAMHHYVEKCTIDGKGKSSVIKMILEDGFRPSFARNLLSNYMKSCPDDPQTKDEVFKILSDAGFQIDSVTLNEYLLHKQSGNNTGPSEGPQMQSNELLKKALKSGSAIQSDMLENYLAGIHNTEFFDSELVSLLKRSFYYITPSTFYHYLINIHDSSKAQNCSEFVDSVIGDIKDMRINLIYNADNLEVNVLQAYLISCNESYETMNSVTCTLKNAGLNLRQDIKWNGNRIKFKKFIKNEGNQIAPICMRICSENKLFSLF